MNTVNLHSRVKGIATALALAVLSPNIAYASTEERIAEIRHLNEALVDGGVHGLVNHFETNRTTAPHIYSQWYVDGLDSSDPKAVELEVTKREFGALLTTALEAAARDAHDSAHTDEKVELLNNLLALAEWLRTKPGYGNALLANRCHDIATVPMVELVADLKFDESQIESTITKFPNYDSSEVEYLTQVLNSEAPDKFNLSNTHDFTTLKTDLRRAWAEEHAQTRDWIKARAQSPPTDHDLRQAFRNNMPPNRAFFLDDDTSSIIPPTTKNLWPRKTHYRFVVGLEYRNVEGVKALYLFRREVGTFPTEPPASWAPESSNLSSPIEAAFDVAWRPYWNKHGPVYAKAARTYEEVTTDQFVDWDTRHRLNAANKRKPGL